MTRDEFADLMTRVSLNWPRQRIPDDTAAKFYRDLDQFPFEAAMAAVESLYRGGREFAPTSAHIIAEIAQQTDDAPEFGVAWQMIVKAIRSYGSHNPRRVVDKLHEQHPAVAQLASQVGIRELGMAQEGDTTRHAQAREMYRSICRKRTRSITHRGLPSAAVPALRDTSQPRRIGDAMLELVQDISENREESA